MNCFPSFHIQANKNKTRSEHFFLLKCNDEGVRTHGSSAQSTLYQEPIAVARICPCAKEICV